MIGTKLDMKTRLYWLAAVNITSLWKPGTGHDKKNMITKNPATLQIIMKDHKQSLYITNKHGRSWINIAKGYIAKV